MATAVAISVDGFAEGAADAVVLARADLFPDALAGRRSPSSSVPRCY